MNFKPEVLFCSKSIIVAVKPSGMPAQPDPSKAESMLDYIEAEYGKAFILNRLDRPAGGILVFARNSKAAAEYNSLLQNAAFDKRYLALIENFSALPEQKGRLENYLRRDGRSNRSFVCSKDCRDGRYAELEYEILKTGRTRALAAVHLLTGRHHQIRAQFAAAGCPIAGDLKYGASSALRCRGIALWSWKLTLPVRKNEAAVFKSLPSGKVWEPFLDAAAD